MDSGPTSHFDPLDSKKKSLWHEADSYVSHPKGPVISLAAQT